jgi:hypothetical protein
MIAIIPGRYGKSCFAMLTLIDIKGPIPHNGLPPFVLTGTVIVLGVLLFTILRHRNKQAVGCAPKAELIETTADTLEQLTCDYQQGTISAEMLITRLADVVMAGILQRSVISDCVRPARRTATECITQATADAYFTADNLKCGAQLLLLCDQVKFNRYQPSDQETHQALDCAAELLKQKPAAAP